MLKIIKKYNGGMANSYILTADGKNAVVIDPATPKIIDELQKNGLVAGCILLTHCHFDHIGGIPALKKAGAKLFCGEEEVALVGKYELFEVVGMPPFTYTVDDRLKDNQVFDFCGIHVQTLFTPGHTQGSVCYLVTDGEKRYLFTGDTLFEDCIGRTDFPTGNALAMQQSLRRLIALEGDMPIYAGHGEDTSLDMERKYNPFIKDV